VPGVQGFGGKRLEDQTSDTRGTPPDRSDSTPSSAGTPAQPATRRKLYPFLIVLAVLAVGGYFLWPRATSARNEPAQSQAGRKGGGGSGDRAGPTPVVAVRARRGNIGVYFNGLGTVTPLNTVTVKSRVDGELVAVHYREGQVVHKGDLLVEIDPRPYQAALTQAEGQLLRDQAALENARVDLARYQTLVPQKAVPEQQLATQQALVHQDEGTIKVDQGLIDNARTNLEYTKITAPLTGLAGLRLVDQGNIVHASDTNGLVVITQIDPISVLFTVAEDQLPAVLKKLRAGQTLRVDAYDRDMTQKLAQGTLTTVDNQIDPTTGTDRIRATFDNHNNALFPNQFVNARLLVEEHRGVVLLPTAAIQRNSDSTFVYLVKPDSTVTIRQVTVGATEGEASEITSGLNPGDVTVMSGADRLVEGSPVHAQVTDEQGSQAARPNRAPVTGGRGARK